METLVLTILANSRENHITENWICQIYERKGLLFIIIYCLHTTSITALTGRWNCEYGLSHILLLVAIIPFCSFHVYTNKVLQINKDRLNQEQAFEPTEAAKL